MDSRRMFLKFKENQKIHFDNLFYKKINFNQLTSSNYYLNEDKNEKINKSNPISKSNLVKQKIFSQKKSILNDTSSKSLNSHIFFNEFLPKVINLNIYVSNNSKMIEEF